MDLPHENFLPGAPLPLQGFRAPWITWNRANVSTTNVVVRADDSHVTHTSRTPPQQNETMQSQMFCAGLVLWCYVLFVVLAPRPRCTCKRRMDGKFVVITGELMFQPWWLIWFCAWLSGCVYTSRRQAWVAELESASQNLPRDVLQNRAVVLPVSSAFYCVSKTGSAIMFLTHLQRFFAPDVSLRLAKNLEMRPGDRTCRQSRSVGGWLKLVA